MADSIDGLTVKMSLDSEEFINQMKKCESSVDKAEKELEGLDRTTDTVSKGEKKFAEYVEIANKQLKQASDDVTKVKREVNNLETATTSASNAESKFSNAVDKTNESLKKNSSSVDNAKQKTEELTDKSKEMESGFSSAKDALGKVNSVLSLFGVSVGIGALISQVKELAEHAANARIEYENLYNKIYFIAGSLSEEQQGIVDELVGTFGKDYSDAIANAVGGISTFFPDAVPEQIKEVSDELVTMQKRGFGDTATNVNLLNDLIKKYNLNLEDSVKLLSYLSATSMDTGESVNTLMSSVINADEIAMTTGKNVYSMIDFFGNAKALGNAGDVRGIDTQFETQRNRLISDYRIGYIGEGMSEAEAYSKAVEEVTKVINDAFKNASSAKSQVEASQIWAKALGVEVGKITNMFADFSMSVIESKYGISTTQRDMVMSGTTLTQQSVEKETPEDTKAKIDAIYNKQLSESFWSELDAKASEFELKLSEASGNWFYAWNEALWYRAKNTLGYLMEGSVGDIGGGANYIQDLSVDEYIKQNYGKYYEKLADTDEKLSKSIDNFDNTLNSGKIGNVTINQNFYTPTADSYVVKNAAQQGINASQSRGMKLV